MLTHRESPLFFRLEISQAGAQPSGAIPDPGYLMVVQGTLCAPKAAFAGAANVPFA